jgi:hypothetical protein
VTSFAWKLTETAAQWLDPHEQEAVLGDLQETGLVAWRGFFEIAGLCVRRQLAPWTGWRPWLAGLGIALPNSFLLMGNSVVISMTFVQLHSKPGHVAQLACHFVFFLLWAWIGGYAVGSISRRTLWASIALCFAPCLFCFTRFRTPPLSRYSLLLFVLPALFGVLHSFSRFRIGPAFALAAAMTATLCMFAWYANGGTCAGNWLLLWPIWLVAFRQQPLCTEAS